MANGGGAGSVNVDLNFCLDILHLLWKLIFFFFPPLAMMRQQLAASVKSYVLKMKTEKKRREKNG